MKKINGRTVRGPKATMIIETVFALDEDGVGVTALDLSLELDMPIRLASAWLHQFERRGILVRLGKQRPEGRGAAANIFSVAA